ncbi:GAF domain-containing protein [Kribbella voronezhensis]|uniref:GAF domain-containing protein n=1 Tax=Kribbella voronezhensis TaxID=2512212 RepID=A0A4R7SZB8_9ACTN|nr:GAF and ANTAR domain-containing protein [Kribbella voronezhensis]TDU83897.1 GAF domain-containing protein [Kribbella voronezhensis]
MELRELIAVMTDVAETLQLPIDLTDALAVITRSAAESVPGVDHVSISVTARNHQIQTLAPTDPVAVRADELQYTLREGPCYEAVHGRPVVQVDDLATDPRWPSYGAQAACLFGLGSQLAFQFEAAPHVRGALNLYFDRPSAIDPETRQFGMMFARLVALALGWARQGETMTRALQSRTTIGQAVGILMERYRLDDDRAFSFLVRLSQSTNVKLHDVAAGIITDTVNHAG